LRQRLKRCERIEIGYSAGNFFLNLILSAANDIWAAGVILYVLIANKMPFGGGRDEKDFMGLYDDIRSHSINPILDLVSIERIERLSKAKDLVLKMLEKDPSKRITIDGILGHPFL
jgi:serine/threonine protein kinase